jgi:hypothetical protein
MIDFDAPWNGDWEPLGEAHEIRIVVASNRDKNNTKEYFANWRKKGEASNEHPLTDPAEAFIAVTTK